MSMNHLKKAPVVYTRDIARAEREEDIKVFYTEEDDMFYPQVFGLNLADDCTCEIYVFCGQKLGFTEEHLMYYLYHSVKHVPCVNFKIARVVMCQLSCGDILECNGAKPYGVN